MLLYEGGDGWRKMILTGHFNAAPDMILQDQRAHRRRQLFLGITAAHLIFDKILRLFQLADIVIIGAHPGQQGVSTDRLGSRLGEISDREGVVIGPGSLQRELAQQRMVEIRKFQQGHIGRKMKYPLEQQNQGIGDNRGDEAVDEAQSPVTQDFRKGLIVEQVVHGDREQVGHHHHRHTA